MEWREQSTVSVEVAFAEAQRWVEEVTRKPFGNQSFRSALENGVLLCDLINRIKPGIIKRVNRLSTPIAGLDNVTVFLKACAKLGLKEAQLFHPGDLQDLSTRVTVKREETTRRLKNVLITIYWLGRKAQADPFYNGPHLNLRAFEGLLGIALSKALEESSGQRSSVRDSGFGDSWCTEREELFPLQSGHKREDSLDSLDSVESRTLSITSDTTVKVVGEGSSSDAEPEPDFRMAGSKDSLQYRRSLVIEPRPVSQFNQFLPSRDKQAAYVPAPLRRKRAERHEDNRRSWASPMYTEEDGTFTRSKSVNDIPEESAILRQVRYEDLQKIRAQVKECEDKWQDDLTKWKNRRRSINSSIVRKKEEQEQMEEMGSRAAVKETLGEVRRDRERRQQPVPSGAGGSLCSAGPDLTPQPSAPARAPLGPRIAADAPYPATDRALDPFVTTARGENGHAPPSNTPTSLAMAPPPSGGNPAGEGVPGDSYPSSVALAGQLRRTGGTSCTSSGLPEARRSRPGVQEHGSAPLCTSLSMDTKAETARVSVSLPRSYQRADSSRLTSMVTPRPFGSQANRISSLPRTFAMDGPHKRFNGEADGSFRSSVPSRYSQFVTSEDEARSQSSSVPSSNEDEEEEEPQKDQRMSLSALQVVEDVRQTRPVALLNIAPDGKMVQESYSDMRISLNQRPSSSLDFGFQTTWDSTGARITSVRQGSPAELCQLQVGDEILAVGGHRVSEMSYEEWKSRMDSALQQGTLVMDIRRHGKNNWDRDLPSLPYKSHKTINLTSMDPTLVGEPEKHPGYGGARPSRPSLEPTPKSEPSSQPVNDLAAKGVNGGFSDDLVTLRNKEYEPISLRNLKRRSEFFEQQGGSESAILDLPVPSISAPSNRWSWDPEEERRRQERWQREQERLLQEKYKRDQEKLEEEWRQAQLEAMKEEANHRGEQNNLQVESSSTVILHSPLVPLSPPPGGEEEQRQQEERRENERREEQQEEARLQELEERREEEERRKNEPAGEDQRTEGEQDHRAKSKSTSELDDVDKPMGKASSSVTESSWSRDAQRKKSPQLSQAELERQQILQEMRKKTQLLTDSSWIRQRGTTIHKEPVSLPGPIRRGESLDNLDSARPWRPASWTAGPGFSAYSRPNAFSSSSLGSGRSGSSTLPTSLSAGSLRHGPWSLPADSSPASPVGGSEEPLLESQPPGQQRTRSVSGRKMCTLCDLPLGKGAAMIIESLGLCYHLSCFKCVSCESDLGGSESGAEVRIRNRQLYCNTCYVRFKTGEPTSM